MAIKPVSRRIDGFWLLRGFVGDSHDFSREKKGRRRYWEEAAARRSRWRSLGRARDTQARGAKKPQGDKLAGVTSL